MSTKADQLELRRAKVVEMRVTGLSYTEIARELRVSKASITSDVKHIRETAKESIKEYITEHLPEQYQVCLAALDTILRHAYEIMTKSDDNREKLQTMHLFKDTHLVKLDLLSNATTIDSALHYIRSKQEQQKKHLAAEADSTNDDDASRSLPATRTGRQSVF